MRRITGLNVKFERRVQAWFVRSSIHSQKLLKRNSWVHSRKRNQTFLERYYLEIWRYSWNQTPGKPRTLNIHLPYTDIRIVFQSQAVAPPTLVSNHTALRYSLRYLPNLSKHPNDPRIPSFLVNNVVRSRNVYQIYAFVPNIPSQIVSAIFQTFQRIKKIQQFTPFTIGTSRNPKGPTPRVVVRGKSRCTCFCFAVSIVWPRKWSPHHRNSHMSGIRIPVDQEGCLERPESWRASWGRTAGREGSATK